MQQYWVVINGLYDDEEVIGVALSEEGARNMVMKAGLSGKFSSLNYRTFGPFEGNEVYDWMGDKL